MGMEPRIIEGVWEDVAAKHASALKGHRVEIRVLPPQKTREDAVRLWAEFEREVAKITRGIQIPEDRMLTAEDFYESEE